MSLVNCIAYNNFGYLLAENEWNIKAHLKLSDYSFDVFEDIYQCGDFKLQRRYITNGLNDDNFVKLDDSGAPILDSELPYEIEKVILQYKNQKLVVIDSFNFEKMFANNVDENLCATTDFENIKDFVCDLQNISDDIQMLAQGLIE